MHEPRPNKGKQRELANHISLALDVGERSLNQAAIELFAVGTAIFTARNSGEFHPLESQREVERLGVAISSVFGATGEIARVHDRMWSQAKKMGVVTDTGSLCPLPKFRGPHVDESNVVEHRLRA